MQSIQQLYELVVQRWQDGDALSISEIVAVEGVVSRYWHEANGSDAARLARVMELVHSERWFDYMIRAERHEIAHWRILVEHSDAIYSSAAEAVADKDGVVVAHKVSPRSGCPGG
jgi:hypothetical protein